MNPVDAISSINQMQDQKNEIIECLRNNKSEAAILLLSELDSIVKSVMTQNNVSAKNVNLILR